MHLFGGSKMYILVLKLLENRLFWYFDLHLFVYIQFTIYAMCCISFHESAKVAGFMLQWPEQ